MEVRSAPEFLQGMNKFATTRQLRLYMRDTSALSPQVKTRFDMLVGSRLMEDRILIIRAKQYRTQD
jgi:hypothetical protein